MPRSRKRMAVLWGAGADADDVVQDAFVKAYAALPRFRADGEFRGWLLTIVRNETRNLFRSRGRRAAREELARLPEADLAFDDPEAAALGAVRRERAAGRGAAAAGRSCARWWPAATCWSCPRPRPPRRSSIPAGTVKSRLHRALTMLRKEVADG